MYLNADSLQPHTMILNACLLHPRDVRWQGIGNHLQKYYRLLDKEVWIHICRAVWLLKNTGQLVVTRKANLILVCLLCDSTWSDYAALTCTNCSLTHRKTEFYSASMFQQATTIMLCDKSCQSQLPPCCMAAVAGLACQWCTADCWLQTYQPTGCLCDAAWLLVSHNGRWLLSQPSKGSA